MKKLIAPWLFTALAAMPAAAQEDLRGAAKVLEQVLEKSTVPQETPAEQATPGQLKKEIEQFSKTSAELTPEDAATRWLAIFDRIATARKATEEWYAYTEPTEMWLKAMPGPAAWDVVVAQLAAREVPEDRQDAITLRSLQLLGYTLINDAPKIEATVEQLKELEKATNSSSAGGLFGSIARAIGGRRGDSGAVARFIEARERKNQAQGDNQAQLQAFKQTVAGRNNYASVPSKLVELAGADEARKLLEQAIVQEHVMWPSELDEETAALARDVALAKIDEMEAPQWELVRDWSDDSMQLYEAFAEKFKDSSAGFDAFGAMGNYVVGLIAADRLDEAQQVLQKLVIPTEVTPQLREFVTITFPFERKEFKDSPELQEKVYAELHKAVAANPQISVWPSLVQLARMLGKQEDVLKLAMQEAPTSGDGTVDIATTFRIRALLSDSQIDQAVVLLRQEIARQQNSASTGGNAGNLEALAVQLAELGRLTKNQQWIDEGIATATAAVKEGPPPLKSYSIPGSTLVNFLIKVGHIAAAEEVLIHQLATAVRAEQNEDDYSSSFSLYNSAQPLAQLLVLYSKAGRHEDVLALTDKAPWWGTADLKEIVSIRHSDSHELGNPATAIAAALHATGRSDDAKHILKEVIRQESGDDAAYGLLVRIDVDEAVTLFDTLIESDPFQERPLIWKARVQLSQGKIADADATIRRAIAIDPSDGEQGKGTRMFAYAVLADVLDAQGKHDDAELFRGAVKAIRLSEDADDFKAAGLETIARSMYEQSLDLFSDAYCIQSRLALEYYSAGNMDEAAKHYQRAFELMPDSFGMVESHCFGCEGAFRGDLAQAIAEEVFTKLLKEKPEQPQVHYLMGYLRMNQERHQDAIKHFEDAVRLAPDYLNAWEKIVSMQSDAAVPPELADQAALAQLRLDPMRKHTHWDTSGVKNLKGLWEIAAANSKKRNKPVESLYTLAASKAALERKDEEDPDVRVYRSGSVTSAEQQMQPGQLVAESEAIQEIKNLLTGI